MRTPPDADRAVFTARDDVAVGQYRKAVNKRGMPGHGVHDIAFHRPYADFTEGNVSFVNAKR